MMDDKIQSYRQPLVTATGILLAFLLHVSGEWAGKAFNTHRFAEYMLALGICVPFVLYTVVLYRALRMDYPQHDVKGYYKRTLMIFIVSITISFLSMIAIIVESFLLHYSP